MTTVEIEQEPWERLDALAEAGDVAALEQFVDEIGPSEAFRALLRLEPERRERILITLSPEEAADLIEEIPDEHAADLIEGLEAKDAATILNEMESDDQVDVLAELDAEDAEAILARMAPEEAADVRELIRYPEDVAGGLMATEMLSYPETTTVAEVIDSLSARADGEAPREVYVYVVSGLGRLVGVVDFRDLVLTRRQARLAELLRAPIFVSVDTSLDELDAFFERHEFYAVPVVDAHQKLVGVVRRKEVREAVAERAEQDYLKAQGIVGGDELRTMPVLTRARRRLSW